MIKALYILGGEDFGKTCSPNIVTGIQQSRSTHELLGKITREEEMTEAGKEGGKVESNTT